MFSVNYYIIVPEMMYMFGEYDRNGKLCTIVFEEERILIVDKSPLHIIRDSIAFNGFDLKGALTGARKITGKSRFCPIMVNYIRSICVFPDRYYQCPTCVWINSAHVLNTRPYRSQTQVEFSDGSILMVKSRLTAFHTKVQAAEQLKKVIYDRGMNTASFILDPEKRHVKKRK
jgi:competence protein ComK